MRTKTVNVQAMRMWVDALRSGDFFQGTGSLKSDGPDNEVRHCCLGVATELAIQAGVEGLWHSEDNRNEFTYTAECDNDKHMDCEGEKFDADAELPPQVMRWLGLGETNPRLSDNHECRLLNEPGRFCKSELSCIEANDSHGMTFEQIASLLEARYLDGVE